VWPEAKTTSEAEERFLKLPDSEDYKRVRQFKIDEKGAVVSRVCEGNSSPCPLPSYESEEQREEYQSRSTSLSSNNDSLREPQPPSTSQGSFKVPFVRRNFVHFEIGSIMLWFSLHVLVS
uniref:PHM7_ext domain-containing protein n=1 Tax=Ascaris lumbricoides TaxID=6252 RepID=A0A0M3HI94_ASCLU